MPHWSLPLIALALLSAGVAAIIALSFVLSRIANQGAASTSTRAERFRALTTEIGGFPLTMLAMSAGTPQRPMTAQILPRAQGARPVLLLHGILCNARVWCALRKRLREAGYGPVEAPDIEPLLADIDLQARGVTPQLLALQNRCGGQSVLIVAHSMGGLIARALLRDLGTAAIRGIVTVATPHHGTVFVRGLPWQATAQMSRRSAWLSTLNAEQEGRFSVPVASIFSRDDNLVAPAESANLPGAENLVLSGVGHLGLLRSHHALDCIMATLSRTWPQ